MSRGYFVSSICCVQALAGLGPGPGPGWGLRGIIWQWVRNYVGTENKLTCQKTTVLLQARF